MPLRLSLQHALCATNTSHCKSMCEAVIGPALCSQRISTKVQWDAVMASAARLITGFALMLPAFEIQVICRLGRLSGSAQGLG